MRNYLSSLLCCCLIILFTSQTRAQEAIPDNISLKINLESGTSYRFAHLQTQNISQEWMDQLMEIKHQFEIDYIFKIEKVTDREVEIQVSYERLAIDMELPQGRIVFDTERQEPLNGEFAEDFVAVSNLLNNPFSITLNREGELMDSEGLESLLNEKGTIEHPNLLELFNKERLLSAIENSFHIFPEDSIQVSSEWLKNKRYNLNSQLQLDIRESYTLEGLSEDLAWINLESTVKGIKNDSSSFDDIKIEGNAHGIMEVERTTGLILFSEITEELEGSIKVQESDIPVRITISETLHGEKL